MKAIYQPKGAAKEYGLWACNLYNGCSNRCDYCYNRHCPQSITLGGDTPTLKKSLVNDEEAFNIFCKEFDNNKAQIIDDGGLFFSFVSDPMLPETRDLTIKCAEYAMFYECPVTILTKCEVPVEWAKLWTPLLKVGFTLTGMDEQEHGKFDTQQRIHNMQALNHYGVRLWASIEPVIDLNKAYWCVSRSIKYCNEYKIGLATKIGVKFEKDDVRQFVYDINRLAELDGTKVYWKDSIAKYF